MMYISEPISRVVPSDNHGDEEVRVEQNENVSIFNYTTSYINYLRESSEGPYLQSLRHYECTTYHDKLDSGGTDSEPGS